MTGEETWDALVVGAGPAGAACAQRLARGGARVRMLEKARLPRYKTCGGGVVTRARGMLAELGGVAYDREHRAVELHVSDADLRFRVERDEPLVSMAMRAPLDHALVEAAVAAGADLAEECALESLDDDGDVLAVRTNRGRLRARCVVACDGALSPTARAAGWHEPPETVPALEWEIGVSAGDLERFADAPVFDFPRDMRGYAWVFPKADHLSVGLLDAGPDARRLAARLEDWLASIGLAERRAEERHGFVIPVRPRAGGAARGRVLLAGDALGLADPVTCEGISHALASGTLAADAILASEGDGARARKTYTRELQRSIGRELAWARRVAALVYGRPRARTWLFERAGAGLSELMADLVAGRTGYRAALTRPGSWGRLARRAVLG